MADLLTRRIRGAQGIAGPLLFVEAIPHARLGEVVRIRTDGEERRGQIIELSGSRVTIQVLEETRGLSPSRAEVELTGEVATLGVARGLLGRVLDGLGRPADGLPPPIAEARLPIHGAALNVTRREKPSDFIETGVSAIDGMNTLVRGQKLPIFSCAGLPAGRLAAQIVCQARVRSGEKFAVVFAAMGTPFREYDEYLETFRAAGVLDRTVVFLNKADDPPIERLMTPRCALTCAEHLAFAHGMQVLVVLTDVTNYCEALREVALAREEVPGRRGYPGYMYTDLASIYERAGRIAGRPGSVTQIPILTMPDDDLTHPIPDLSGYITEGQIVLSRDLDRKGVYPPIDVLPSLSRLMGLGAGPGRTRDDHRPVADQLYAFYARGRDVRRMAAIVGAANLGEDERRFLDFADRFEAEFVGQGGVFRSIEDTLEAGWKLLGRFPPSALTRVPAKILDARRAKEAIHEPVPHDADGAPRGAGSPGGGLEGRKAAAREA
jgi:V/A-type H+-transporting ATPase subunit B